MLLVDVSEPAQDLDSKLPNCGFGKWNASLFRQERGEVAVLAVFEDKVKLAAFHKRVNALNHMWTLNCC